MDNEKREWTEDEDELVLEQGMSDRELAGLLDRTVPAIHTRRYHLKKGDASVQKQLNQVSVTPSGKNSTIYKFVDAGKRISDDNMVAHSDRLLLAMEQALETPEFTGYQSGISQYVSALLLSDYGMKVTPGSVDRWRGIMGLVSYFGKKTDPRNNSRFTKLRVRIHKHLACVGLATKWLDEMHYKSKEELAAEAAAIKTSNEQGPDPAVPEKQKSGIKKRLISNAVQERWDKPWPKTIEDEVRSSDWGEDGLGTYIMENGDGRTWMAVRDVEKRVLIGELAGHISLE